VPTSVLPPLDLAPFQSQIDAIASCVTAIPDFPKPGILFRDMMPVLQQPDQFERLISIFVDLLRPLNVDYIAGIESRGFILGAPLALKLGVGFVPVRKKGKLPGDVVAKSYDLEYGTDTIEIQANALPKGASVVLIDDLLATGGTAGAAASLLGQVGADLKAIVFMMELPFLEGRSQLPQTGVSVESLIKY
jgi:adenine phosphoribosyltransferase